MCGICGIIHFNGEPVAVEQIRSMLPPMERRGPDNEGWMVDDGVALGHRRLSIIDLSDNGNQPMIDPELGLTITYNGELYNYADLKDILSGLGYRFFSDSDTEVILKAYHAWGDDFVKKCYGMFAFCIHDRNHGRYLLGRDRLGIKPLYYVDEGGRFYFASNIQSLAAAGVVDGRVSPEALHHYLSFHAVIPAPYTIFAGVRKLEPGTILTIDDGGVRRKRRFWNLRFERGPRRSEEEWVEEILSSLRSAVRRRLVSDVPVGALLSGGVDSSLIVGLMAEMLPAFRTYSIGFDDVGDEEGNEFRYSDVVAEAFGTDHRRIFIHSRELLPRMPSVSISSPAR